MYQLYVATGVSGLQSMLNQINEADQTIVEVISRGEQHIIIVANPKKRVKD